MLQNTQNRNDDRYFTTHDVDAFSDHADDLMDDLFGAVENTLHVGATKKRPAKKTSSQILPYITNNSNTTRPALRQATESSATDSASTQIHAAGNLVAHQQSHQQSHQVETPKDTVSLTRIDLNDVELPPVSREDILWIEPYVARQPDPSSDRIAPPINFTETKPSSLLDRLLLVGACSSALLAAVMWSVNQGLFSHKAAKVSTVANSGQLSPDKQQFADEIKRSFTAISEKNNRTAANPNNLNGLVMPNQGTNSSVITTVPGGLTGINGVTNNGQLPMATPPLVGNTVPPLYVPVYQPPTPNGLTNPIALPPVSQTDGNTTIIQSSSSNLQPTIAPASTSPSYTLIGLLDLGERSSAMFDVNGTMQTIGLGKQVGNSGWVLSRISQQEVTIRRGSETKSIFIGQKF
jgi:hypothetical protein